MRNSEFVRQVLLTFHLVGLAFGLGAATVADFSFFKAIKMGDRITPETVNWMRSFSKIVWIGLGLLTISGLGLFLMHPSTYLSSPGFLAKMLFVAILAINGLFLNFYTTARLTTFNFSEKYTRHDAAWKARKLSFIFGAISTVSWYSALFTAELKNVFDLPFAIYVDIYLLLLIGAIIASLVLENFLHSRLSKRPQKTIDHLTVSRASAALASSLQTPVAISTVQSNSTTPPIPVVPATQATDSILPKDQVSNQLPAANSSNSVIQATTLPKPVEKPETN